MDNDTIQLDCARAEDELSGYLDDVLDPQLRRSVETHLATCERCQLILADFQRGDALLRAMPLIEPPEGMRDRFFNSPRYLKQVRERERQRNIIKPLAAALVAAAVLVVALGGYILVRQSALGSQTAGKQGTTTTIGNNGGGAPLSAGSRLVYERGGSLWSAPESGAGLPAQLTPAGIQVAGWSVSPNGHMVMYIDAHTGALHNIRADGLNDSVIGKVTGGSAPTASFWTTPTGIAIADGIAWSPDNTRIAYLTRSDDGTTLHVINAAGAADTVVNTTGVIGHPLWSADGLYIAYTSTQAGAQSVWVYNVPTARAIVVASQSDAHNVAATVSRLAWMPSSAAATVTWSTSAGGKVTGVFRAAANTSNSVIRLTPVGSAYSAADISASGVWLLAREAMLWKIAADQTSTHMVATLARPITQIHWAPSGTTAAVVSGATLDLVTPGQTPIVVAQGLLAHSLVVWSPKGDALAWQSGNAVMSARVRQGVVAAPTMAASNTDALGLAWAPDGRSLAVRSSAGLSLVTVDGARVSATDSNAAANGQFAWSEAG